MMAGQHSRELKLLLMTRTAPDWRVMPPPEWPPTDLSAALATPLRALAGCWLEQKCSCRTLQMPIRRLLTDYPHRAEMTLRRAVSALARCEICSGERHQALASHPRWKQVRVAGKPPNWSLTLTGPKAGAVAFTKKTTGYGLAPRRLDPRAAQP
jgi:hypothetical protein